MNARQKCKRLKKELEQYKNFTTGGIVHTYTSIPIEHYQCKTQIFKYEINEMFNNDEEKADEIARRHLVVEFNRFIDNILPVKKEITEDETRIYRSDLYIGVNNE